MDAKLQYDEKGSSDDLYLSMCSDIAESKADYDELWASLAPTGNAYKYCALVQERWRHAHDVGKQIDALAEEFGHLFEVGADAEGKRAALVSALKKTTIKERDDVAVMEKGLGKTGFVALEEFLDDRVVDGLFSYYPEGSNRWSRMSFFTTVIFVIQVFGPMLMFVDGWYGRNYLVEDELLWQRLKWSEIICLQRGISSWTSIIMGSLFLVLMYSRIRHACFEEYENSLKLGRMLPSFRFWVILGNIANSWSVILTIVFLPFTFWNMKDSTELIITSVGVIFILCLDDLSDFSGAIFEVSDAKFKRMFCWQYILLSRCPVDLKDIVNKEAKSLADFWQVTFDRSGLRRAACPASGRIEEYVETRVHLGRSDGKATERSPLLGKGVSISETPAERVRSVIFGSLFKPVASGGGSTSAAVGYRTSPAAAGQQLPHPYDHMYLLWFVLSRVLKVVRFVVPLLFLAVNKPCVPEARVSAMLRHQHAQLPLKPE